MLCITWSISSYCWMLTVIYMFSIEPHGLQWPWVTFEGHFGYHNCQYLGNGAPQAYWHMVTMEDLCEMICFLSNSVFSNDFQVIISYLKRSWVHYLGKCSVCSLSLIVNEHKMVYNFNYCNRIQWLLKVISKCWYLNKL